MLYRYQHQMQVELGFFYGAVVQIQRFAQWQPQPMLLTTRIIGNNRFEYVL
jgi:hypothetical protein